MKLTRLPDVYSVCRLPASDAPPCWLFQESSSNAFCSMTKTADELSIVCQQDLVPTSYKKAERNWNVFKVEATTATTPTSPGNNLPLITQPLADARISIFTVSTCGSDYLIIKKKQLDRAKQVLKAAGHMIEDGVMD
jgi:hypothetical protein